MELRSIIRPDESGLTPLGNDALVEEVGGSPAHERWRRRGFNPFGEGVDRYQQVTISLLVGGEGAGGVDAPASERGVSFGDPAQRLRGGLHRAVSLASAAFPHTLGGVGMHAWPPVVRFQHSKQLIPAAMAETAVGVHQDAGAGHKRRDVDPSLGIGGRLRETYL